MAISIPEQVTVAGITVSTSSFSDTWRTTITALTTEVVNKWNSDSTSRLVVAIAGPSGSSKSTIASVMTENIAWIADVHCASVSVDAFHYPNEYLDEAGLFHVKGRYDTYDTSLLHETLLQFKAGRPVSFPQYSRITHEPIAGVVSFHVEPSILILEGLWLLFDMKPWSELYECYDMTIFFNADEDFLHSNTVSRHLDGGKFPARDEAIAFYEASDARNRELILAHRLPCDREVVVG